MSEPIVRVFALVLIVAMIVPALAVTPAAAQGACGSAPAPRLTAGQSGRVVVSNGVGNNLRDSPTTAALVLGVLADGEVFSVLSGPQCAENGWWWQVRRWDGQIGWTVEGESGKYWVEPWPILDAKLAPGTRPNLPGLFLAYLTGYEGYLVPYAVQISGADLRATGNTPARDPRLAWSPDGTRMAFSDGNDIWVASQSDIRNITNTPVGGNVWPTWSPDGFRIAFASMRDGNAEVYSANADGSNPLNLTNNPASDSQPAWSPDGTRIAFASDRDGNSEIYSMSAADGADLTRHTATPTAADTNPVWSPDGAELAYVSAQGDFSDLWVIAQSGPVALTANENNRAPVWSPDGARIAYIGEAPIGTGREEVFSIRADGTDKMQYTVNGGQVAGVAWSPGGVWLVYADNSSGNFEVYTIRASGIGVVALTNNPGMDVYPVFQPPTTPNRPDESASAAPGPVTPPSAHPGAKDLLLIYNSMAPAFTLQNVSGQPVNLAPLSFSGNGITVPSSEWVEFTASPLESFKPLGCLMIWPFGIPDQPAPAECGDARQGWVSNSALIFWTAGSFTVSYNGALVATCDTGAGRCDVDLP
jgi:Tol biopolymer transport system component